jgi:hypothetical protein
MTSYYEKALRAAREYIEELEERVGDYPASPVAEEMRRRWLEAEKDVFRVRHEERLRHAAEVGAASILEAEDERILSEI